MCLSILYQNMSLTCTKRNHNTNNLVSYLVQKWHCPNFIQSTRDIFFWLNKTMSQFLAQVISVTVKVKRGHFLRFWANKWQDVMTAWKWNIYVVTLRVCIAVRYIILASFWMKQHITEKVLLPSQWWWWSDPQIEYRKCIKKKIEMYSEISQVSHASLPLLLA